MRRRRSCSADSARLICHSGCLSVALGARQVEDDWLGLVVQFLFFLLDDAVGMQELVGDVSENGGAAGRHAAFGCLDEEARKEIAQVFRGGEMGVAGEEVRGEVCGVIGKRGEDGGDFQTEMARTKTKLRFQAAKTALGAIVIAMQAAGVGWRRISCGRGGWGFLCQDFYVWGLRVHGLSSFCRRRGTHPRHCCKNFKTKGLQIVQFVSV